MEVPTVMRVGLDYELDLLARLVGVNTDATVKTGYLDCARIIVNEAKRLGLEVEVYDSKDLAGDGKPRPNVIAELNVGAKSSVALVTHYDVVPPGEGWMTNPFKLEVIGDKAYGRGACDDKGAIAAALGALRLLKGEASVNVKFVASPDEEVGGTFGVGYLLNQGILKCDEAIILDASIDFVSIGASGIVHGGIVVRGVQGHAAYPHIVVNPINGLINLLNRLSRYTSVRAAKTSKLPAPPGSPLPKVWGRFSITMLKAGEKENVIPGEAMAKFDLRVLPDEDVEDALTEFKAFFLAVKQEAGVEAELVDLKLSRGYYVDPEAPLVKRFREAASRAYGADLPVAGELGANDGRFFAAKNIPVVCFGCIRKESRPHGVNEYVYLKDLAIVRDSLINFLGK